MGSVMTVSRPVVHSFPDGRGTVHDSNTHSNNSAFGQKLPTVVERRYNTTTWGARWVEAADLSDRGRAATQADIFYRVGQVACGQR